MPIKFVCKVFAENYHSHRFIALCVQVGAPHTKGHWFKAVHLRTVLAMFAWSAHRGRK